MIALPLAIVIVIYLSAAIGDNESKKVECPTSPEVTKDEAIVDYNLGSPQSLIYCYCIGDIQNRVNEKFSINGVDKSLCFDVYKNTALSVLYSSLIALVLTLLSMIIDKILKGKA